MLPGQPRSGPGGTDVCSPSPLSDILVSCGVAVSVAVELEFTPGAAGELIDLLWQHLSAAPGGVLVGAVHLVGDHGQIVVHLADPQVQQLVVFPGQVLRMVDPADPLTWQVLDGRDTMHLRQPK